ncbi:glycerophosphoryl diester phosphodiesterase membrane domain-containing protein [Kallotenue papyrolyticum]|uniref:glycerophosphoryl diester phosphodiesterase membrane domain-containing protein n=1 Tax=Kallotenue papyrolyticum TaxID=1325125 RepID=UPI000478659C|nr:glycerophosphoryl diester phosphodiesterase membrane domain-containing protein [Kallotenue papyrolyticum]
MVTGSRLRPLSAGELLDEAFRLYRNNLLSLLAITALVQVPYMLISSLLQLPLQRLAGRAQDPTTPFDPSGVESPAAWLGTLAFSTGSSLLVSLLYAIVFLPLLEGALTFAVAQRYLARPISLSGSFRAAFRRLGSLVGARLLLSLASLLVVGVFVGMIVSLVVLAASSDALGDTAGTAGTLGAVLCSIVLVIVLGVGLLLFVPRLLFTSQAVMVEGVGAIDSLRRSWQLTAGFFWRVLGLLLLITLITWLISVVPALIIVTPITLLLQDQPEVQFLISAVVSTLLNVVVLPFTMIAYTLIYFDLRVRKEGFDLEQQAGSLLVGPAAPSAG